MAFEYADNKPAKFYVRMGVSVERNKDGTFNLTYHMDDSDEYAEDFCGRELYVGNENVGPIADAVYKMVDNFMHEKLGNVNLANDYLPDDWEEPLTPQEQQRQEFLSLADELRAILND